MPVDYDAIANSDGSDHHPLLPQLLEQLAGGARPTGQEGCRHHDLPHPEPPQQGRHPVEVIGVGVGKHQAVDHGEAFGLQHRRQRAAGCCRRPEPAGIVDEAATRG